MSRGMRVTETVFVKFLAELRAAKRPQALFVADDGSLVRMSACAEKVNALIRGDDYCGEYIGVYRPSASSSLIEEHLRENGYRLMPA